MKNPTYHFGNNGSIPFRYIKRSASHHIENVVIDPETNQEITFLHQGHERRLQNLSVGFSTFGVSQATQSKIAKHCRVLALAAERRTVRNSQGNYVDHLCTFLTLTLPAEQVHTDQEITKKVLGTFLDKCRKLGLLSNYVWRAEKQKNGNIHYHILTDTFANFSLFRRLWYLALRPLGYMSTFSAKFSAMTFEEYRRLDFNKNRPISQVAGAYAYGVRNKWSEPPAVHSTEINDVAAVAKYVSKYVSKGDKDNNNCVTGRAWGASQSVTKSVQSFCRNEEFSKNWYNAGAEIMKRKMLVTDFFSLCFFKITSLVAWFPECQATIKRLFEGIFTPCPYWQNSVGLFTT